MARYSPLCHTMGKCHTKFDTGFDSLRVSVPPPWQVGSHPAWQKERVRKRGSQEPLHLQFTHWVTVHKLCSLFRSCLLVCKMGKRK